VAGGLAALARLAATHRPAQTAIGLNELGKLLMSGYGTGAVTGLEEELLRREAEP
jgi:hypothetical protein